MVTRAAASRACARLPLVRRPSGPSRLLPLIALAIAACDHGDALSISRDTADTTLLPGTPARLTYSPGVDRDPSWLPDESAILYSGDRPDLGGDRCVMLLPPAGGRVTSAACVTSLASRDSINTVGTASISAGGVAAFVRTSRPVGQPFFRFHDLVVGDLANVDAAASIRSIPFTIASRLMSGVAQVRWVSPQQLVYRAGIAGVICIDFASNGPCPSAFVESGIVLVTQDVSGQPDTVPGTLTASSVAVDPAGDAIYYTLIGDSRVFRRVISAGVTTIFHDFGALGIARNVQVSPPRLVATVGGAVRVIDPAVNGPSFPPAQFDQGGPIYAVDIPTAAVTAVTPDTTQHYGALALSPSGTRLVAERGGDLWLFRLP